MKNKGSNSIYVPTVTVPDKRSRILEVVVVRRLLTWVLGIGVGREWGRVEEGEVSLRVTLRPRWTDSDTERRISK
jgi:hypothetical protein